MINRGNDLHLPATVNEMQRAVRVELGRLELVDPSLCRRHADRFLAGQWLVGRQRRDRGRHGRGHGVARLGCRCSLKARGCSGRPCLRLGDGLPACNGRLCPGLDRRLIERRHLLGQRREREAGREQGGSRGAHGSHFSVHDHATTCSPFGFRCASSVVVGALTVSVTLAAHGLMVSTEPSRLVTRSTQVTDQV